MELSYPLTIDFPLVTVAIKGLRKLNHMCKPLSLSMALDRHDCQHPTPRTTLPENDRFYL